MSYSVERRSVLAAGRGENSARWRTWVISTFIVAAMVLPGLAQAAGGKCLGPVKMPAVGDFVIAEGDLTPDGEFHIWFNFGFQDDLQVYQGGGPPLELVELCYCDLQTLDCDVDYTWEQGPSNTHPLDGWSACRWKNLEEDPSCEDLTSHDADCRT